MNDYRVAITAMGCRFPGGVTNPGDLWRLVQSGTDATGPFPTDRVLEEVTYRGGFLHDAAQFAPSAFGMSPREAELTDPQQRVALQVAAETLHSVGLRRGDLRGTATGVFIGAMAQEYGGPQYKGDGSSNGYGLTGTSPSVISGRIAYHFGLTGPALTVDTACSASLVAIHQAVSALRQGSCEQALAGGVTVMPTPALFADFAKQGGIAADGRCKAFSSSADGVAWAEGCGLLLLETVEHARANGRVVLGIISGIAINQDGASNGLTAPNGKAQERVVAAALRDAGLEPGQVDLLEAHGTGTPLGDAIEVKALARTYGNAHQGRLPAYLGSLKSNIGHAQAAAGVGGVIKVIEALRHQQMPSTLHVEEPTTQIDWASSGLQLLSNTQPWPTVKDRPRHAGVSSFGISGTNAHVIVTEGASLVETDDDWGEVCIAHVSGETETSMRAHAARVLSAVEGAAQKDLPALLDATRARPAGAQGVAVIADNTLDLARGLRSLQEQGVRAIPSRYASPSVVPLPSTPTDPVLVFPGQGAQWAGMTRSLYRTSEAFRRHFDTCAAALDRHADGAQWRQAIDDPQIQRPDWVQPALFATTVALARTWLDLGVRPRAVVGSSQGEIAAAHVAGVLDLDTAATVVCRRSALIHQLAPAGGMLSTRADRPTVEELVAHDPRAEVAVENAPHQTVVAGDPTCLEDLREVLEGRGIDCRRIAVNYASHTAAMEPVGAPLLDCLAGIEPGEATIPMLSTLTGDWPESSATFVAGYWYQNLRHTVRFREAITRLIQEGATTFLEVSPHPVMGQAITEILEDADVSGLVLGSLLRDSGDKAQLAVTAAALGVTAVHDASLSHEAPPHALQTQHLWVAPAAAVPTVTTNHFVDLPDGRQVAAIDVAYDWITQHQVAGRPIAPGTVVLAAIDALLGADVTIDELILLAPITGDVSTATVEIQRHGTRRTLTLSILAGLDETGTSTWVTVARATASINDTTPAPPDPALSGEPGELHVTTPDLYRDLDARGYGYGPAFQGAHGVRVTPTTATGEVSSAPDLPWALDTPHPVHLDTMIHVALPLLPQGLWVPYRWRSVTIGRPPSGPVQVRADLIGVDTVRLRAEDHVGNLVIAVEELTFAAVDPPADTAGLKRVVWDEVKLDPPAAATDITVLRVDHLDQLPTDPVIVVDTDTSSLGPIEITGRILALIQQALQRSTCTLVVLTHQAVAVDAFDTVRALHASPLVGLVRTAATENPGRVRLVDIDTDPRTHAAVPHAVASDTHTEIAIRRGKALHPHVADPDPADLDLHDRSWRLDRGERPTIDDVGPTTNDATHVPLGPGQVRVDVRSTGLNFRDVTVALGMLPSENSMGCEVAGVITEVGSAVQRRHRGEAVFGFASRSIAPTVITDVEALRPLPRGWGWSDGAASVIAGVTALRSLELAEVKAGDKVLIHAATGGVGQVLVTLAQVAGAEVFATAHPDKHHLLQRRGIDASHRSTSRSTAFEEDFEAEMDTVINCLSGPLVDASLRLLRPGGTFIELGKTDLRNPGQVREDHHVTYLAYNVIGETPAAIGGALERVTPYLEGADLHTHAVDVRHLRQAVSLLRHAQHPGKLTLSVPPDTHDLGTCLITGGTSGLGALCAEHLLRTHRARHVVLVSRRGQHTPGVQRLLDRLHESGGSAEIRSCDITHGDQVQRLVDDVEPDTVIHAAGTLKDVPVGTMGTADLEAVMKPKVLGALNLDRATANLDLTAFVMFSSALACLGSPGQGNYTAANTFLDALASSRRQQGQVATCINWGLWAQPTGMTSHLSVDAVDALARRTGLRPIPTSVALGMLDAAIAGPMTSPVAAHFETPRARVATPALIDSAPTQGGIDLMKALAADVLGYPDPQQIDAAAAYRDLGFDSLLTIDLRNRISDRTGRVLKVEQVLAAGTLEGLASVLAEPVEVSTTTP